MDFGLKHLKYQKIINCKMKNAKWKIEEKKKKL